jgi:hypothetical protein
VLSLITAALVVAVSITGIFNQNIYSKESANWKIQSVGQDKIDLMLITPVLLITSIMVYFKRNHAVLLWVGVMLYLTYTFIIYSFAVHFNLLYPVYCLILGLCFYSLVYYFFHRPGYEPPVIDFWTKLTGIYFIVIAILFYGLWFSEILTAIFNGTTPATLQETGLPANPVHSIDLALFLPGVFLIGFNLLRKNPFALEMTPAILAFFILMNLTIGFLGWELGQDGLPIIMASLALISIILLLLILKRVQLNK